MCGGNSYFSSSNYYWFSLLSRFMHISYMAKSSSNYFLSIVSGRTSDCCCWKIGWPLKLYLSCRFFRQEFISPWMFSAGRAICKCYAIVFSISDVLRLNECLLLNVLFVSISAPDFTLKMSPGASAIASVVLNYSTSLTNSTTFATSFASFSLTSHWNASTEVKDSAHTMSRNKRWR